jgi:membrane-associated phospholipid phosphatase
VLLALVAGGLIFLSIAWLDHPIARWMERVVDQTPVYRGAVVFLWIILFAGGALVLFALGAALSVVRKRPVSPVVRTLFMATMVGAASLLVAELLKFVIGRSAAYPDFLIHGRDVITPFHPGSLPSGTASASSAMLAVVWQAEPRFRTAYGFAFLLIGAALIVTNSHWLSDILAGTVLGGLTGFLFLRWR